MTRFLIPILAIGRYTIRASWYRLGDVIGILDSSDNVEERERKLSCPEKKLIIFLFERFIARIIIIADTYALACTMVD